MPDRSKRSPLRTASLVAVWSVCAISGLAVRPLVAAPPSLPPLHFSPFGAEQKLIPDQSTPAFLQPRPLTTMNPMFTLSTQPFGDLGDNVFIPGSFQPHRQPLPAGARGAAAEKRPTLMPSPGFTKGPRHRMPLGW